MPFDDLRLQRGLNGMGLPFPHYGVAAAADVARATEPRHDEPTCCGERQVTECRPADARADETSQVDSPRSETAPAGEAVTARSQDEWFAACSTGPEEVLRLWRTVERLRTVSPSLEEANAMLVAAQHIEAYLGRPSEQSILLRDLCRRVREIQ